MGLILLRLFLFLLPLAMLLLWLGARRRAQAGAGGLAAADKRILLALGALFLALIVLAGVLSMDDSGAPGSIYVPPRVVDGELVPGHFEAPEKADEGELEGKDGS
ncbi:MAG: DUF6111 family protein [Pseudomonadota bacterium]